MNVYGMSQRTDLLGAGMKITATLSIVENVACYLYSSNLLMLNIS